MKMSSMIFLISLILLSKKQFFYFRLNKKELDYENIYFKEKFTEFLDIEEVFKYLSNLHLIYYFNEISSFDKSKIKMKNKATKNNNSLENKYDEVNKHNENVIIIENIKSFIFEDCFSKYILFKIENDIFPIFKKSNLNTILNTIKNIIFSIIENYSKLVSELKEELNNNIDLYFENKHKEYVMHNEIKFDFMINNLISSINSYFINKIESLLSERLDKSTNFSNSLFIINSIEEYLSHNYNYDYFNNRFYYSILFNIEDTDIHKKLTKEFNSTIKSEIISMIENECLLDYDSDYAVNFLKCIFNDFIFFDKYELNFSLKEDYKNASNYELCFGQLKENNDNHKNKDKINKKESDKLGLISSSIFDFSKKLFSDDRKFSFFYSAIDEFLSIIRNILNKSINVFYNNFADFKIEEILFYSDIVVKYMEFLTSENMIIFKHLEYIRKDPYCKILKSSNLLLNLIDNTFTECIQKLSSIIKSFVDLITQYIKRRYTDLEKEGLSNEMNNSKTSIEDLSLNKFNFGFFISAMKIVSLSKLSQEYLINSIFFNFLNIVNNTNSTSFNSVKLLKLNLILLVDNVDLDLKQKENLKKQLI